MVSGWPIPLRSTTSTRRRATGWTPRASTTIGSLAMGPPRWGASTGPPCPPRSTRPGAAGPLLDTPTAFYSSGGVLSFLVSGTSVMVASVSRSRLAADTAFSRTTRTNLEQLGINPEKLRHAHPLLAPHPFDSFRKRMTLVRAAPGGPVAYVKGAPKDILRLCAALAWRGEVTPLTEDRAASIVADHDRMAGEGLRLLAVARRPMSPDLTGASTGTVERDLTLLGIVAIWDPPRPEVKEATTVCRHAGIRVVMVTGDYGLTGQAIARHLGLPVNKVVTGEEFDRLRPEARQRLLMD